MPPSRALFEVETGGIVIAGDSVTIGENMIGNVAGYSDIHSPNHFNIIVRCTDHFAQGFISKSVNDPVVKLSIELEETVTFGKRKPLYSGYGKS